MSRLPTNPELLQKILTAFIANEVRKTGLERVVVGLSGGVDSALSAFLAATALGAENVLALKMPYKTSSKESLEHADLVVAATGIHSLTVDISPQIDAYFDSQTVGQSDSQTVGQSDSQTVRLRRGNKMARERMSVLYDHSARWQALVLGTSNKTELLLGYGTLYGDMASAVNPLGDLYKTQVWALAHFVGVPQPIVEKPPSADLWAGQTDETELGFSYREVDELLYLMVDQRYSREELCAMRDWHATFIDQVSRRIMNSQYKRRLPVIAKVSQRTIDRDFRYARDWGR